MAEELSFTVRDIPSCARYGFSARKIWVYFKKLVLSWLIWDVFVYLGYFAAGSDMAARWNAGRLLPLPGSLFWTDPVPVAFLIIGLALIIYVLMRGSLAVSKLAFQQIRGDDFYSVSDAESYASKQHVPLISVPLVLLVALGIAGLCGLFIGLIARIPAAGPVVAALLTIPGWGVMLLGVLTAAALILSIELVPVVTACTGGDSFEAIFEVFSTLTSQFWRLLLYGVVMVAVTAAGGVLFALASSAAAGILGAALSSGSGGGGLAAAIASGPQLLAPEILPFFSNLVSAGGGEGAQAISGLAGVLAGVSGTAIFLIVLSYIFSSWTSGMTLIFVVLKYRKDGEDLPERADRMDQAEFQRLYGDLEKTAAGE